MANPIPKDHISLSDAWEVYYEKLWNSENPIAELSDENIYKDLPEEYSDGHKQQLANITKFGFRALIRLFLKNDPKAAPNTYKAIEDYSVTSSSWETLHDPSQLFIYGDLWREVNAKAPFVPKCELACKIDPLRWVIGV